MKTIPKKYEIRDITTPITTKEEEGKKVLYGFIPYNSKSAELDEIITPSAFTKSIKERNIIALVNHDTSMVIGNTKNNTLILRTEADGLYIECILPETSYANDVFALISRGDVETMSFGFQGVKVDDNDGITYLREVKLFEVSFSVPFPAYEATSSLAKQRSLYNQVKEERNIDVEEVAEILLKKEITEEDEKLLNSLIQEITILVGNKKVLQEQETAATNVPDQTTQKLEALKKLVLVEQSIF